MSLTMQPEFSMRMSSVFHAIDDVLIAHHSLRASLKAPYPPLGDFEGGVWIPASLEHGLARYGEGPLFALWMECRAVEALRIAWTGKPSQVVQQEIGAVQQPPPNGMSISSTSNEVEKTDTEAPP